MKVGCSCSVWQVTVCVPLCVCLCVCVSLIHFHWSYYEPNDDFGQACLIKTKTLLWLVLPFLVVVLLLLLLLYSIGFSCCWLCCWLCCCRSTLAICSLSYLFMSFAKCTNKAISSSSSLLSCCAYFSFPSPPPSFFCFSFHLPVISSGFVVFLILDISCALVMQPTCRMRNIYTNHINHTPHILHINACNYDINHHHHQHRETTQLRIN